MEKRSIKGVSVEEMLRQQLQLLAERSKNCSDEELPEITKVMLELSIYLSSKDELYRTFLYNHKI